jgi:penicillin-insensitive murein endopeptidase
MAVRGLRVLLPLLLLTPAFADDASTAAAGGSAGAAAVSAHTPALPAEAAATPPPAEPVAVETGADSDAAAAAPVEAARPDVPAATDVPPAELPALPALLPALDDDPAALDATEPHADPAVVPAVTEAGADSLDPVGLARLAHQDVAALGPLSIGTPDAGLLVNPRPMPGGALWTVRNPLETWGTQETIDFVVSAIEAVEARHPGSPRLVVGDISRPDGGRLNRHRSHQAGRDVDVGFYYAGGEAGDFRAARKGQLDLARTWALVRAFVTRTDVDRIFVDRSVIAVLYRHARDEEGEHLEWLDDVFGRGGRKGIIQHERRHKDHLHVRFFNRVAQEKGRIVHPVLVEPGVVGPPTVKHVVRRGETLGHLASRYGASVSAIKAANGLRSTRLRAGRAYVVPVRRVRTDGAPLVVPPRRLPPGMATQAEVAPEPSSTPAPASAAGGRN